MAVFLVTWDLNQEKPNYAQARQALITHLQRYPYVRDPGLDSVWFLESFGTASQVRDDVRTKLDDNDRLLVTELVSGQHEGWLANNVWAWIGPRL
jgi:hypothetical protein